MEAPAPAPWPALGVLLIRDGLVSRTELEAALAEQGDGRDRRVSGQRLGEALVERGVVTTEQVARLVAEQHELPFVDLDESDSIGPVATKLPEELARRCSALPIRLFPDGSLLVAVADPGRLACLDDIRRVLGVRVRWAVAAPDAIKASIEIAARMTLLQAEATEAALEAMDVDAMEAIEVLEPVLPDEPVVGESSPEVTDNDRRPVLGSLLLRDGLVTEEELDAALAQQRLSNTRRLGEILVARGALSEAHVSRALAEQHELPFVELSDYDIDLSAAALLPVDLARRHSALAISHLPDGSVLVVVADPTSSIRDEELRASLGVPVQYAVAVAREIETAIASAVEAELPTDVDRPPVALVPVPVESEEEPERDEHAGSRNGGEPDATVDLPSRIGHALALGATAVHFEPRSPGMVISGRVDGALRQLATLPNSDRVTDELTRLTGLDVARATRPHQRNALPISLQEDSVVELEAVVLPTTRGPRVTLRVVEEPPPRPPLSELVPDTSQRETIQTALAGRRGLLVFCGTPGSALTATLYAAIQELDAASLSVLTLENPVHGHLDGIHQIEVDPSAGVSAASALRAILASDPDVVALSALVDEETAHAVVLGAGDTLILTTLGAMTAASGARRLCELGGDPALVSTVVTGIVAQQILPSSCLACRETYYATADELFELGLPSEELGKRLLGRGRGCDECGGSGYRGETSLVEVLPLTDDVRALIADGSCSTEVEDAAGAAGMRTLREQGIVLCLEGVTTTAALRSVRERPRRRWQS